MELSSHALHNFPLLFFFLCLFFLMEQKQETTKIMFPSKTELLPSQEPRSKWKLQDTTKWN
jgi:hypothetical protein